MDDLALRTATELKQRLADGTTTCVEIMEAVLAKIAEREPEVGAFLHLRDRTELLLEARAVDERRRAGHPVGPLAGLPVAVKDNICTRGVPTTCGSKMLRRFVPPYDATVVEKIRAADGLLLGKTNMDEFAMGSTTENSALGRTRNPHAPDRVPGGSSGGSAAAVAAGMTVLALGSDTGGSIRQPASYCGVVGLKPTYGRVSRYGLVAYGSSLDQIGPLARSVEDAALLLAVLAGHDPRDSTSIDQPVPDYAAAAAAVSLDGNTPDDATTDTATPGGAMKGPEGGYEGAASGFEGRPGRKEDARRPDATGGAGVPGRYRFGIPKEHFGEGVDPEVDAAIRAVVERLRAQGHTIVPLSLPHTEYAIPTYYILASAEASSNLARYDGAQYGHRTPATRSLVEMFTHSRSEGFGEEVKRRILLGTHVLSSGFYDAYYLKASRVRTLIARDFEAAFRDCDVVLSPVAPTPAYRIGEKTNDPLAMYLGDVFSVMANLAGLPAIALPCGTTQNGLPIGAQLTAPPLGETTLLAAARRIEGMREKSFPTQREVVD